MHYTLYIIPSNATHPSSLTHTLLPSPTPFFPRPHPSSLTHALLPSPAPFFPHPHPSSLTHTLLPSPTPVFPHQAWFSNARCFQWGQGQRLPRLVEQLIEYDTVEIQGGKDANPLQQVGQRLYIGLCIVRLYIGSNVVDALDPCHASSML
jgi:hypothetical protein